jgi:hypothetical protein
MTDDDMDVIKTSDFMLASTLNALGFDIHGIDKSNRKRVVFYFRKTSDLEVALQRYWKKEIQVVPQDLDYAQRELRAKIHTDYD